MPSMSVGKLHHNCPAESFRFVYCQQTNIQIKICWVGPSRRHTKALLTYQDFHWRINLRNAYCFWFASLSDNFEGSMHLMVIFSTLFFLIVYFVLFVTFFDKCYWFCLPPWPWLNWLCARDQVAVLLISNAQWVEVTLLIFSFVPHVFSEWVKVDCVTRAQLLYL